MTSPICLFCGYPRSAPVAGCDHSTLPTAGEEMASAFRSMEPLEAVPPQPLPVPGKEDVTEALIARLRERQAKGIATYGTPLQTFNGRDFGLDADEELLDLWKYLQGLRMERTDLAAEVERLRDEAAILGPELVDLQRQVVALQRELEQERQESGRLRADLENAQQLLSEAERGGAR